MCIRCDRTVEELVEFVAGHVHEGACPIPKGDADFRSSVWWFLAVAHAKMSITMDRMETSKRLFDDPEDLPREVLGEWEAHVIAAAELLARARARRESKDARVEERRQ